MARPGVLAAKVSDLGSNLLKWARAQRWGGTKRAKKLATWLLAPSNVLKCSPGGGVPQEGLRFTKTKKVFRSHVRSTGGPDLLKWSLPGGGIKSAKVAPTRGRTGYRPPPSVLCVVKYIISVEMKLCALY